MTNFREQAKELAHEAHCRYCGLTGYKCETDVVLDEMAIHEALLNAYDEGKRTTLARTRTVSKDIARFESWRTDWNKNGLGRSPTPMVTEKVSRPLDTRLGGS